MSVVEALSRRRSCRQYADAALSTAALSSLLLAAYGATAARPKRRTAPSAGALYPLSIRVIARRIERLDAGLYRYHDADHALIPISENNACVRLEQAVLENQPWVDAAPAILAISADLDAARARFFDQPPTGERGVRYAYMETGAVAQNVQLQATAVGLGCVLVAGFDDATIQRLLCLPENDVPTALLCLGLPA